jgi:uncharacterized protein YraI
MGDQNKKEEAGRGSEPSGGDCGTFPERRLPSGRSCVNNRMSETNRELLRRGLLPRSRVSFGLVALGSLLAVLAVAGCARQRGGAVEASQASGEAALRHIAAEYAQDQDLARAQADLSKLGLANPTQLLVTLAEQDIAQGRPQADVEPLARLAEGLGVRSPALVAYLEPSPSATSVPPSSTPEPPLPTIAPTGTPVPLTATPTATTAAPTATPTATPRPQVLAQNTANLRSGPGKAYPLIGRLEPGQSAEIIARNASGDWWQLSWKGQGSAWVAGTTVKVQGPIDTVAVAKNVPPPPPPPTAGPPTAPPPTPTPPKPAVDYRVTEQRILTQQENGGCAGKHNIFVQVLDASGAPVNGAVVDARWTGQSATSGAKDCYWAVGSQNQGCAEFDLYKNADNVRVVSDPVLGPVTSEESRQLSSKDPDISDADLIFGGYCANADDCAARRNPGGDLPPQLCYGHYSWIVKFQRTH